MCLKIGLDQGGEKSEQGVLPPFTQARHTRHTSKTIKSFPPVMFPIRRPANGINNFMHSVRSVLCVSSPATAQAQLLHSADGAAAAASRILNIHVTRSLSKQLAAADGNLKPPAGVPPYLRCGKWRRGWCSEGGRCTGDSGKNISSSSPVLADG